MIDKERLIKILIKKAEGFTYKEVISEYAGEQEESENTCIQTIIPANESPLILNGYSENVSKTEVSAQTADDSDVGNCESEKGNPISEKENCENKQNNGEQTAGDSDVGNSSKEKQNSKKEEQNSKSDEKNGKGEQDFGEMVDNIGGEKSCEIKSDNYENVQFEEICAEKDAKNVKNDNNCTKVQEDEKIKCASNDAISGVLKNKKIILQSSDVFAPLLKKQGVQCSCEAKESPKRVRSDCGGLKLIKRKVTRHYVQPDVIAMKLLFEVLKTDDDSTLSLDELLSLKNNLEKEILRQEDQD